MSVMAGVTPHGGMVPPTRMVRQNFGDSTSPLYSHVASQLASPRPDYSVDPRRLACSGGGLVRTIRVAPCPIVHGWTMGRPALRTLYACSRLDASGWREDFLRISCGFAQGV